MTKPDHFLNRDLEASQLKTEFMRWKDLRWVLEYSYIREESVHLCAVFRVKGVHQSVHFPP